MVNTFDSGIVWGLGGIFLKNMYLKWDELKIDNFSEEKINDLYNKGYVFTRIGKGIMNQTRSVRINLKNFDFNSENKRILRKTEEIQISHSPIPYLDYDWKIAKLGKEFYEKKFKKNIFSANKIKEILTSENNNFNKLFIYKKDGKNIAFAICFETKEIIHYSYPFYNLDETNKNIGMAMMTKAIEYALQNNKKYIYLGSAQRPGDIYKFQFKNMEYFDSKKWCHDFENLKQLLSYENQK